ARPTRKHATNGRASDRSASLFFALRAGDRPKAKPPLRSRIQPRSGTRGKGGSRRHRGRRRHHDVDWHVLRGGTRDPQLLRAPLAHHAAAHIMCPITTLDPELARRLGPRAASPERRLAAVRALTDAGVPVGVMVAPVIPGLNDAEIPAILAAAAAMGARAASWTLLRLAKPLDEIFTGWLAAHYSDRQARVLHRIRETRDGRISDSQF